MTRRPHVTRWETALAAFIAASIAYLMRLAGLLDQPTPAGWLLLGLGLLLSFGIVWTVYRAGAESAEAST